MKNFLDDIPTIDWEDLETASAITKIAVQKLAARKDLLRTLVYEVENNQHLFSMCERHLLLDYFVLYDAPERNFRVRMHLHTEDHLERPHDHRFPFTTLILRGKYTHLWNRVNGDVNDGVSLEDIQPIFATEEREGSCYTIHDRVVHTTYTTPGTISLVIRGAAVKEKSIITDRATGRLWWRFGRADEDQDRRKKVEMKREDYLQLRARLESFGLI